MFSFFFPKFDPNTNEYWQFISQQTKNFLKTHDEICYKCKRFSTEFKTHPFCKKENSPEKVVTCFYYNNYLKKILLNFKYYHQKRIWKELAQVMKNFYLMYLPTKNTAISFVPMHWTRKYFIKGYNQSEILAKNLAKILNLPFIKICKKTHNTTPQAKISSRKLRLLNLKNSFSPAKINLPYQNIVIIDDLITTWTTLEEVTKCIKQTNPSINVFWLVLARK